MFGNFSQQMKNSTKPASTLLEMNAKTLELLAKQQTLFFSGLMTDSVKLMNVLCEQTEMKGVIAAQSVYAESLRERLTIASTTTCGAISTMGRDVAGVMKSSLDSATEEAKTALPNAIKAGAKASTSAEIVKPSVKKTASVKTAAKKTKASKTGSSEVAVNKAAITDTANAEASKKTLTPKAAPLAKSTTAANKPAEVKTQVSKAPAQNADAKKAEAATEKSVASSTVTPSQAAIKNAAPKKTVANLSPADVKAEPTKTA